MEKVGIRPKFISLDGEGISIDGEHYYTLIQADTGDILEDANGLTTEPIFNWLLTLARENPKAVFISFSFSYDANMILKGANKIEPEGLPTQAIAHLKVKNFTIVSDGGENYYIVEYLPKKWFTLKEVRREDKKVLAKIKVFDVFAFFQCSFVKALNKWNVGTQEQRDFIERMKSTRGEFQQTELEKQYNALECELLTELTNRLADSFEQAEITVKNWHGPGAIASSLYTKYKIKNHLPPDGNYGLDTEVRRAYFGGRIQALQMGFFESLYSYDLRSAYPHALLDLPGFADVYPIVTKKYEPGQIALYEVTWSVDTSLPFGPFPFRDDYGCISYPYSGRGFYWSSEVGTALKHFTGIKIKKGYVFEDNGTRPFSFIGDLFLKRKELKAQGNSGEHAVKLALNSLYGKLAQTIGAENWKPPFQSLIHAGLITSKTRARLLNAAMQNPLSVVQFATDGIHTTEPLGLTDTGELGSWESKDATNGFILKPGFYQIGASARTRGVPYSSVDWEVLKETFQTYGLAGKLTCQHRQFVGMKSALSKRLWCQWVETPRVITFMPSHDEARIERENPRLYRCIPPDFADGISRPYSKGIFDDLSIESDDED